MTLTLVFILVETGRLAVMPRVRSAAAAAVLMNVNSTLNASREVFA
jgi:hypothetical protein